MGKRRKRLPTGEFEAVIESMSHDGKGICRLDGKVHFIFGALPGERVLFEYVKVRSKLAEGRCTSVIVPSEQRQVPPCPRFGVCGGCSLQHMSPAAQLKFKQNVLLEQLRIFGGVEPKEVLEPIHGPHLHYRRSARLGARWVPKKGGLLVGFRERYSHYVVEMDACPVLTKDLSLLIPRLKNTLGATAIAREIPQVEVYDVTNGLFIVVRHLAPFPEQDIASLKEVSSRGDKELYIFLQPKGPDSIHPLSGASPPVPHYELSDQGLRLEFSPGDFIQVNEGINRRLIRCALDLLAPDGRDVVYDLFCGIGNFTLPIAQVAKQVIGMELSSDMVERARGNALLNGMDNVSFYTVDLYDQAEAMIHQSPLPNKVLLDPPRSGAQEACQLLANHLRPERIVYVSCNPATFSRDAGILAQGGYSLQAVRVVDMFPHTSHAETIGLFL